MNKQTLSLVHVCVEGQDALAVGVSPTPRSAMIGSEKDKCSVSGSGGVVGCEYLLSVLTTLSVIVKAGGHHLLLHRKINLGIIIT